MDTLRAMRFFVRTMELGSLSAVARDLETTQPTVSKVLALLEAQMKVRLLERSTKGPVPTEQGLRFYDQAKSILEQYEGAVSSVQGLTEEPTGLLRINAPVAFGQFRVNAWVQEFLRLHPGISVELILNDRFIDLVEEGVDVSLRLGAELPPNVIGRHLAVVPRLLVASHSYLERRGAPLHPDDLVSHDFVRFAWSPGNMIDLHRAGKTLSARTNSRYRVNNALAIREALALGSGIGLCPEWLVHDLLTKDELVRVLPEWTASSQDLHLLYPSRRYQPLRSKLFIEFTANQFIGLPGFYPPS
ncbi:LysR substrate-binding domain-containing protein [Herbaspirillum sp. GCM10030257]|uniref:LysR family transcriptional regulator n=1 Tax=Herbaspirillum sp. GCM10030257 TaxID=3273393 RepID=UPI00361EB915